MATYAIGDIHGCVRTFQALLQQLPLQPGDSLILLGDLIDRGPDSKGVIDLVFRLREHGHSVTCLRGNHEQLMLEAFEHATSRETWMLNGGSQTLDSFQAANLDDIPTQYLDFFNAMPHWYEVPGYLCVHGGPDFSYPNPLEPERNLLWVRRWYDNIDYKWLADRIILHGHTPADFEEIENQHSNMKTNQYLNLDNGCVYAALDTPRDLGRLLAFSLDTGKLISQKYVE